MNNPALKISVCNRRTDRNGCGCVKLSGKEFRDCDNPDSFVLPDR